MSLNPTLIRHNIRSLPKASELLQIRRNHFGRWVELSRAIRAWRADPRTKTTWISQKRKPLAAALREFEDLYNVSEFYAQFGKHDDTFEVCYREKASFR